MDRPHYEKLKANYPFPWIERNFQHPRHGILVQIIAANGLEVPIPAMAQFLNYITTRLQHSEARVAESGPIAPTPGASA